LTAACAALAAGQGFAQTPPTPPAAAPSRPPIETTKVEGTDGVYIFRNVNHQSMFIVTKAGVIATDPIAYGRPTGGQTYVDEIKKVTSQPIKYLIYSHHHFDHIAGGKAFKDAGARIISHSRAKERLAVLKDPHTVLPDETFDGKKTITLGGTTLELSYLGLNHSDSTIVMRLPKEKIIFVVDTIPVGSFPGRGFIDIYPLETEEFIKKVIAMDWDRMIPGHPGAPGASTFGEVWNGPAYQLRNSGQPGLRCRITSNIWIAIPVRHQMLAATQAKNKIPGRVITSPS
jgi:glyoxylase-like metal-dependent hydrolase (beta-lactamase superfamily II)